MNDVLSLLEEFYREKLGALLRHEAGAMAVGGYDANNAYQYIVNRDEMHLTWLSIAVRELGGSLDQNLSRPDRGGTQKASAAARSIFEEDARQAQAFVDRWRPRVDAMGNARHRRMLLVILGEELEQKRSFEQALAGRTDLLGSRPEKAGARVGAVLSTRSTE